MRYYVELENNIMNIKTKKDLKSVLDILKVLSSNDKNKQIVELIDKAFSKSLLLDDSYSQVILLGLKIAQIYLLEENRQLSWKTLKIMKIKAETLSNTDGLAFTFMFKWLLERIEGNKEKSSFAINKALKYLNNRKAADPYITNMCNYSYAIEIWLENHDYKSAAILQESTKYFLQNSFYRTLAHSLGILSTILSRKQDCEQILEISKKIFSETSIFDELPKDIKAISYYLTGLGYMLNASLNHAEMYFRKAYSILKSIQQKSIYFSNYVVILSFLSTVTALQGKLENSYKMIEELEGLLKQEFYEKNLDLGTKKQIYHSLNLNKFYIYSRLKDFDSDEMYDLVEEIFIGSKTLYSDFMLLNEFILNSNLELIQLKELLTTDNFSINRVKHIISFVLLNKEEKITANQQFLDKIKILATKEKTSKTTLIESVFADLLIAQQLFALRRYGDIYPLLRKYKKQLDRIEVLELRVFMEAFIQVGIYKIGDPLGPALQYMAIKKCRQHGFSRLENKLLDYLNIQGSETLKMLS